MMEMRRETSALGRFQNNWTGKNDAGAVPQLDAAAPRVQQPFDVPALPGAPEHRSAAPRHRLRLEDHLRSSRNPSCFSLSFQFV